MMKVIFRTFLVLIVALLSLTCATLAAASAQRASVTVTSEKAYRIDTALDKAELQVGVAALARDESRAEARIGPCLSRAFVAIFEAVIAKSNANADKALKALGSEAGAEYEVASIKPITRPLLKDVRQMLKLSLPPGLRARLNGFLPAFAKVQSLNVCADARAWLAGGLTPAHEPRGTTRTSVALTDIRKLTGSAGEVQLGDLTASQVRSLKQEKSRSAKHVNELIKQSDTALKSWIAKLIRGVEITVEATQTSTTGMQTSTTGT